MPYTTEAKIRQEAGFQNNDNISSTVIGQYQTRAYNLVRSFVSGRYDITLFSGANFTGSQAESVLEQCELLIAAGYLISAEYQGQPRGDSEGKQKVADGMAILKQIASGELKLVGLDGALFPSGSVPLNQGGTAEYTAPARLNTDPTSSERRFGVNDRY